MAFFKFRPSGSKGDEQSAGPAETIDGMRRRARHRLIGAALLVLVGVVGFPLLFDTQPRPVASDIPIDIPDKAKVKPLNVVKVEKPVETEEPVAAPAKEVKDAKEPKVSAESSLDAKEEVVASRPVAKAEKPAKPEPKPEPKPESKPEPKAEPKPVHKPDDDAAKARALLDGKAVADAGDGRFIVQVGAFADADKAREARLKLEHAGLKTYTQVVDTKDGPRTRVRVGPFTGKAEAEKAANKIKGLALPASILSL
ncbi:SPOR domain-containing protein [Rhodoferax sp.]|uniref:SPOR domain-containing protein n=1 Tax=Rhodoferax sp. TaxID=50421 RepID=UPI0025E13372|nr:SPOR domain-containing protein [Rhodoferax sp.]